MYLKGELQNHGFSEAEIDDFMNYFDHGDNNEISKDEFLFVTYR